MNFAELKEEKSDHIKKNRTIPSAKEERSLREQERGLPCAENEKRDMDDELQAIRREQIKDEIRHFREYKNKEKELKRRIDNYLSLSSEKERQRQFYGTGLSFEYIQARDPIDELKESIERLLESHQTLLKRKRGALEMGVERQ